MAAIFAVPTQDFLQKTLGAQLLEANVTSATLNNVTGIQNLPGVMIVDRVNTNNVETPAQREVISYTGTSGSTVVTLTRGLAGTTDQDHAIGAIVEFVPDVIWAQSIYDALTKLSDASTGLPKITLGSDATGDIYYRASGGALARLPLGTSGQVLSANASLPAWSSSSGGTAFWTDVPGTPTRVSDTQFTITDTGNANSYDLIFKKGVILKWLESSTFQTAMVISSSYSSNAVTINIVGDSLTAGFTAMKYAIPMAQVETFIIPGAFPSSAATDIAKTWYTSQGIYILSADFYVKTAGTTNSTDIDINDDGTTKFTTKPSIASAGTSDINNVADSPSTEVAAGSLITVDVDAISTTAPVDGYVYVYYYPTSWRYRS